MKYQQFDTIMIALMLSVILIGGAVTSRNHSMPEQSAPLPAAGDIPVVNVPMTKSAITEATADVPDASYRISSQEIYLSGKVIVSVNPDTGARHRP